MRFVSLALALGLVAPSKSSARVRADRTVDPLEPASEKQSRRRGPRLGPERRTGLLEYAPLRSPCGRHLVEVDAGAIFVDGKRIHPSTGTVQVLAAPTWRHDGKALAWLERGSGETRLVVIPEMFHPTEVIVWPLPSALGHDQAHWAGDNRIVVGPELMNPRAVASWK